MTSKLTREERVQALCDLKVGQVLSLADIENVKMLSRMALAAMDSEPVAYIFKHPAGRLFWALTDESNKGQNDVMPVYASPQPAPVVPDDVLKALQKVARIRLDMDGFDGDRRGIADCLCDAEEALIEVVNRRAAMFNHPEQHLDMVDHSGDVNEKGGDGNSPVIPDGYVMVPKEPTDEMIAAAMNCEDVLFNSDDSFCVQFGNIYEAMLAAAPQEVKP